MFQTQQCGGGGGGDPKALGSRPLKTQGESGDMDTASNIACASQEIDANALAKAINPKMQLCLRMGNPENPTRASGQGLIRMAKGRV